MKSHHWIIALCIGILLGVFVFKMTRPLKPQPNPVPDPTPTVGLEPPDPPSNPAETSSASDLVRIPGGPFHAGANNATVDVPAFWIDRTEVTNGQYEEFLNECPLGSDCGPHGLPAYWDDPSYLENRREHPVVHVSWDDASAFCSWEEGRLPSAQEWEKAARGKDERIFPAGSTINLASVNLRRQDEKKRAPRQIVTWGVHDDKYARDRSPFGVLGMAGNVSEWTASASEVEPKLKLAAGGSFDSWNLDDGRVYYRLPRNPIDRSASLGFRCAFSFQQVISGDMLRVLAEPGTPPMLTLEGGSYGGFDWDIANAIARRIGVERVKIVGGNYSGLPGRLISGEADVIISGYTADPSIEGVEWSDSYLDYGLCLVVRKGSSIRSIDDLQGKVIGIFNDPAAESDVKKLVRGYRRLEKYEDGYFDLLANGQLDAFLYDYPYAKEEIKPFGDKLDIVQFNLTESTYNIGVRRGATNLLKMVNSAIRRLKGSDEYGQIVRRHLGGTDPPAVADLTADQEKYSVAEGDTLSKIARDRLGKTSRWTEIWDLNKDRIADPNLIEIGWELIVPKD